MSEIYTTLGDADAAIALLEHSLGTPRGISVNMLRLDPIWDPLRSDHRFEKLVAADKSH
jgi:hypothetical protein